MLEIGGIPLLPEWPVFAGFALAGLALNLVPGADMAFVATSAARHGRRGAVLASLGIAAGTLIHILAAALGLSAILASSQVAFNLIKYAGALYLLWIAVMMIRSTPSETKDDSRPGQGLFRSAMLVNLLNPKVALFFLAFLPQFIDPAAPYPALRIVALGLWFDFVGTLVNIGVGLTAAMGAARLRHASWAGKAARWLGATAMGALAVQLALSTRRTS